LNPTKLLRVAYLPFGGCRKLFLLLYSKLPGDITIAIPGGIIHIHTGRSGNRTIGRIAADMGHQILGVANLNRDQFTKQLKIVNP